MTAAESTPDASLGVGPAAADAEQTTSSSAPFLQSRLQRLQELDGSVLREEWRRLVRSEPPRISRDLLMRALAYRLQELAFGGLPKWARQSLAESAAADPAEAGGAPTPKPALPRPKPGARLVREWHGRIHSVIVLDDAFEFEGKRYRSLTQIAREITGAHWSGPRFFGFVKRRSGGALDPAPTLPDDPDAAAGLAPSGKFSPPIEARNGVAESADARRRKPPAKESADG
jgi:hypothetical protein